MADDKPKVKVKSVSGEAKAQKTKWAIVGGLAIVAVVFVATMMVEPPPPKPEPEIRAEIEEDEGLERRTWIVSAQAAVEQNASDIQSLESGVRDLNTNVGRMRDQISDTRREMQQMMRAQQQILDRFEAGDFVSMAPPRENPTAGGAVPPPAAPGADGYTAPPRAGDRTPPPPLPPGVSPPSSASTPGRTRPQSGGPIVMRAEDDADGDLEVAAADVTYVENPWAGHFPAGSHMPVVLMTGVDAGASEFSRANPAPVMMRIQSNAVLPGNASYGVESCVLMGTAFGNLSSERVEIRVSRISCVDLAGNAILESPITGYVVDADSTLGMRGRVDRRSGQLLARAALASVLEGITEIAEAASQAATTAITTPVGAATGTQTLNIDSGQLGQAAGFGGLSGAAEKLSDYYLTEARNIFPVIHVDGGRRGTVVIQEGTALEWAQYRGAFVRQITPET